MSHARSGLTARFGRRVAATTVALGAMTAIGAGTVATAAQEPVGLAAVAAETGDPQSTCTEYDSEQAWSTSTKWGRATIQGCMEFTSAETRPVVRMRIDWPSDCETTYGVTTIFERQCETLNGFKSQELDLRSIMLPLGYTAPGRERVEGSCSFSEKKATMPFLGGVQTYTCTGSWEPIQQGATYTVDYRSAQADVADDGRGNRSLEGREQAFRERGGTFVLS